MLVSSIMAFFAEVKT